MNMKHTIAAGILATSLPAGAAVLVHNSTSLGTYDGSADPTGFTKQFGTGTLVNDSPSVGIGTATWSSSPDNRFTASSHDLGTEWTVEARFKVNSNTDSGVFQLLTRSGQTADVWIDDTGIRQGFSTGTIVHSFASSITGDNTFHTIRIGLDSSGDATIWWDDTEVATLTEASMADIAAGSQAVWGDSNSSLDDGVLEIDYVHYNTAFVPVPEPSSTALLGLGGLALILRRRK